MPRRNAGSCSWTTAAACAATTVVNAAGAWGDVVAALFGAAPVGLVPRRRSAFTFRAPEGVATAGWPAVVGVDEGWYFKPDAGQLLGSPADEGLDPAALAVQRLR